MMHAADRAVVYVYNATYLRLEVTNLVVIYLAQTFSMMHAVDRAVVYVCIHC